MGLSLVVFLMVRSISAGAPSFASFSRKSIGLTFPFASALAPLRTYRPNRWAGLNCNRQPQSTETNPAPRETTAALLPELSPMVLARPPNLQVIGRYRTVVEGKARLAHSRRCTVQRDPKMPGVSFRRSCFRPKHRFRAGARADLFDR